MCVGLCVGVQGAVCAGMRVGDGVWVQGDVGMRMGAGGGMWWGVGAWVRVPTMPLDLAGVV